MNREYPLQSFNSPRRRSQSLGNESCQNILYKAAFEHFKDIKSIATLLLASKSFQNSSFGPNFVVNYVVDENSILLINSVLSPSSCFSFQFAPSLHIKRTKHDDQDFSKFVGQLVETNYLHLSLRSLTLQAAGDDILMLFFGSTTSSAWPQLRDLTLDKCELGENAVEAISKNALQLRTVNLSGVSNATLIHISKLSGITSLDLSFCEKITDAGVDHLSKLSGITSLNLFFCPNITDAGIRHVAKLSNLTSLNLSGCRMITDAGIELVAGLSNITSLNLSLCILVTDAGLEHISQLSDMTSLSFVNCNKITNAGLEHISTLSSITALDLSNCKKVTDVGLVHLSTLSGITSLSLTGCDKITDAGLEHLSSLQKITALNLYGCRMITDAGLEHIAKLSRITSLDLSHCKIMKEGKTKFMSALPNCCVNDESPDYAHF